MTQREVLSLEEARRAMHAIMAEAEKEPERPISVAIVDDRGDLVLFLRQDGARPLTQRLAFTKAYTAARLRRPSAEVLDMLKTNGWTIADFGDPNLTSVRGGVCIPKGDNILGGIGVSGLRAEEDEALAQLGVQAMGL